MRNMKNKSLNKKWSFKAWYLVLFFCVLPSREGEGGHSSFAPNSEIEIELLQFMKKKYNHVSNENLVSGPGIEEIFNFIRVNNGLKPSNLKAPEIGKKALEGDLQAKEAVKLLFSILGTIVSWSNWSNETSWFNTKFFASFFLWTNFPSLWLPATTFIQ